MQDELTEITTKKKKVSLTDGSPKQKRVRKPKYRKIASQNFDHFWIMTGVR
jgi:hypothetical protein